MTTPNLNDPSVTVGDIVAADYRAAAIFERHEIDFCCGGATTLAAACASRRVEAATLVRELEEVTSTPAPADQDYATWNLARLIDHIQDVHHVYVRENAAQNTAYARKIANVHGDHHAELVRIAAAVESMAAALMSHLQEEEQVVFPAIKRAEAASRAGRPVASEDSEIIARGLESLTRDHEEVGAALHAIRDMAMGYALPPDACATYSLTYRRLRAFEADLHKHVHLENNVLFPRAEEMTALAG